LDISNLAGLSDIVHVGGDLIIAETNHLTDLNGLSSLASVGGEVGIYHNFGLNSLDGLSSLTTAEGGFGVYANPEQTNVDGLSSLTSVGGYMVVSDLHSLTNVDGLRSLTTVGNHLGIMLNHSLTDLNGLSALTTVGGLVNIGLNPLLTNVDGLHSLTKVAFHLTIVANDVLSTLDGLSGLTSVGLDVTIESNKALAACAGLSRLLDQEDDAEPGPGPSAGGVPDVGKSIVFQRNLPGCNSIAEVLESSAFQINCGLNDAWHNPATPGQGLFVTVLPDISHVFLAWMTYDTERPGSGVQAKLGDPGHRWLTAFGPYTGNEAMLELVVTRGGVFDAAEPAATMELDGTVRLEFVGCNAATVRYDIPSIDRRSVFHIERIARDNVMLCEAPVMPGN
jgi:hypothetical protein